MSDGVVPAPPASPEYAPATWEPGHSAADVAGLRAALAHALAQRDAKGAFLSYMAHELRNPLSAVICWADLLCDTNLSQEQREMLAVLHDSAQQLVGIINNVLDLARLDAGRLELEDRPFEIRACVEEVLELLAVTATPKGLELAYAVDEATPARLVGDGGRLRQVLINLVGNAVKFTTSGHIVVSLATRRLEDGRHEVRISVQDTGPGIPPERQHAIFGEFVQADAGTAARFGGSGLGLSISRRLVEMMGGRMWLESQPGTGTTIHLTLPARSADATGIVLPGRQLPFLGKRLLIVHHDDAIARLLADQVGRWGMHGHATTRAAEALARLSAGVRFDAALINQHVEGKDGRSLASEIRRLPDAAAMPLVLLTSLGDGRCATGGNGGREALFATYVGKPVKPAQLHQALLGVFAAPASRAGAVAHGWRASRPRVGDGGAAETPARPEALTGGKARTARLTGTRVLLAEDDPMARGALTRLMRSQGSEVLSVADGREALEAFEGFDPDVVLLDGNMPRLDGFETCRQLKEAHETRLVPVVLVTGLSGDECRLRGIEAGADDLLRKPIPAAELVARVRALAGLKHFTDGLDRVESVLVTVARCVERRDANTHGHCERLSDHASRLGRRLQLDAADLNALRLGGIVHDIGKVAVPDAILHKPGRLTDDEWAVMRRHSVDGEQICSGLTAFRRVLPIIRHHHEKQDGSGYPDGLRGDAIPLTARVLQIVDVYDALTSPRPYKAAMTAEEALRTLRSEVDRGWWDANVFAAFVEMLAEDSASPELASAPAS